MHKLIVCAPDGDTLNNKAAKHGLSRCGYFQHSSGMVIGTIDVSALSERKFFRNHPTIMLIPAAHSQADISALAALLKLQVTTAYALRAAIFAEIPIEELCPDF